MSSHVEQTNSSNIISDRHVTVVWNKQTALTETLIAMSSSAEQTVITDTLIAISSRVEQTALTETLMSMSSHVEQTNSSNRNSDGHVQSCGTNKQL